MHIGRLVQIKMNRHNTETDIFGNYFIRELVDKTFLGCVNTFCLYNLNICLLISANLGYTFI